MSRSILAAPGVGMIHGTFGAVPNDLEDRRADGNAFPGERLVRIPRRFVATYHGKWLLAKSRLEEAAWYAESRRCAKRGHDWRVDASIGPDSGSEHFACRRCGEEHEVGWY